MKHRNIVVRAFFRHYSDSWESYVNDAEIIWGGDHYVVIRTGMSSDKARYVYLVDKEGLQYDEDAPALVQIAGGLHPAQAERAYEKGELLHSSNQRSAGGVFKGRWSKSLRLKCIAFAESRDATYEHELPSWIKDYETRKAEEKAQEQEERQFSARLLMFARQKTRSVGTDTKSSCWNGGVYGTRRVQFEGTLGANLSFCSSPQNWKINVWFSDGLDLNESQFKRYMRLLCKFHAENVAEERAKKEEE